MARPKVDSPKIRMNLDVRPEVKDLIETLKVEVHADSMSEVVRRAVLLYDHMRTRTESGAKIIIRNADGTEHEIILI